MGKLLGWLAFWVLILSASASAADAQSVALMKPSTGWTLEFGENSCAAIRTFGTGPAAITLAVMPSPGLGSTTLGLVTESRPKLWQQMRIGLSNRKDAIDTDLWVDPVGRAGRWMISTFAYLPLDDLEGASQISFTLDRDPPIVLAVGNTAALLKAIRDCDTDLMKRWGIGEPDPARAALVDWSSKPGDGGATKWITTDDYPQRALIDRQQGMVVLTWVIDVDGRVRQCHVTRSSGWPLLDDASCQAIIKRGRYVPERNANGEPVRSIGSRRVIWRIPE